MQNDSYNRGGYLAFLFSMVFSLGFFVYVTFIHPGIDLKEVPAAGSPGSTPEVKVDLAKIEKPWVENKDLIAQGAKTYANVCSVCHGQKGMGDGPGGRGLVPPPRNFVEGKWTKGGDSASLFQTISAGIPGSSMVGFSSLPIVDRWALVQFIRSITQNRVKDDPAQVEAFAKAAK